MTEAIPNKVSTKWVRVGAARFELTILARSAPRETGILSFGFHDPKDTLMHLFS